MLYYTEGATRPIVKTTNQYVNILEQAFATIHSFVHETIQFSLIQ